MTLEILNKLIDYIDARIKEIVFENEDASKYSNKLEKEAKQE